MGLGAQSWSAWKKINKYTDDARLLNKRTQISSKQARSDKLRQTTGAAQRASSITTVHAESPGLNIISADSQSVNPFADAAADLCVSDGQPGADAETYELEDASSHGSVVLPEVGQAM
ncbi:hypothetical protein A0H81_09381 [Grifola frondosa]|uniref:Uncharacterized protein n=1 Tax=Grifola frondosa TaxID=5627 RepID=A0A1C7M1V8_GRIFR|nr:hypothetical protein A0H81_09381 [Grifola frondosa]